MNENEIIVVIERKLLVESSLYCSNNFKKNENGMKLPI
jgi:hypothetical protein